MRNMWSKTCLMVLMLLSLPLRAQSERIALSSSGELNRDVWRHDVADYTIQGGWLSLAAQSRSSGRKLVSLTTRLSDLVRWEGVVRLSALPSVRNHAYILLGCYAQVDSADEYDYLALSIGGGRRESIALVELRLRTRGHIPWHIAREHVLIETHQSPSALARGGVRFSVTYDKVREQLSLNLSDYEHPKLKLIEASTKWSEAFDPSNSFGILCVYTASRHSGFHFGQLNIYAGDNKLEETEHVLEPQPTEPLLRSPLLSEVMANPAPGCPEYIELYNPNDTTLPLEGYSLLLTTSPTSSKRLLLDGLSIDPRGMIVLTSSPKDLQMAYPDAPEETFIYYRLPTLPNGAFRLSLYADDEPIDVLNYNRLDFPKGLRTKRGVALERAPLHKDASWTAASSLDAYATPGRAPRDKEPAKAREEIDERQQGQLQEMLERVAADTKLHAKLLVSDLLGRTLVRLDGRRAVEVVRSLIASDGRLPMTLSLSGRSGVMTFYLENSKTKQVEERWTLGFICK